MWRSGPGAPWRRQIAFAVVRAVEIGDHCGIGEDARRCPSNSGWTPRVIWRSMVRHFPRAAIFRERRSARGHLLGQALQRIFDVGEGQRAIIPNSEGGIAETCCPIRARRTHKSAKLGGRSRLGPRTSAAARQQRRRTDVRPHRSANPENRLGGNKQRIRPYLWATHL